MKRIVCFLLVLVMALMLTACSKFECDLCGEEKTGTKYTTEILGKEVTYCKDCYEELEELGNMFGG